MAEDFAIGSTLAGYRLEALIARGGMGVVYRATHLGLEREVALKVIARELADQDGFRQRFLRESRLAARLDHPSVVPIFDSREVDGELIVAMRLVHGGDLRRLIERDGPLEPERAIALLGQVGEALDAAHAAGIVHRDVKPHNVLVEGDRAFLSDFGLAKAVGESGALSDASIVGTAQYMSPEQWRGDSIGPAADVYSLGCVLYEALTGIAPFVRKDADTEPVIPGGLEEVIERAVAKDPAERFPSAGALIAAARERQGDTPAATRVLSASSQHPTQPLGRRRGASSWRPSRHQLQWGGAAVAVAAAILVLAFTLLSGGGVDVSAPIAVGAGPLRIATGREAIWVTSEPDGTLTRLDPGSGEVVGKPVELGAGIAGVTVGAGSVWVSDPAKGEVLRVDPDSGAVSQRVGVGGRPGPIVFGGDRVWVGDDEGAGVSVINAEGGRVIRRDLVTHAAPLRLAVGGGGLWVSSASTGTLRRIDLSTVKPGRAILAGRGPAGVTFAQGLVWVANSRGDSVTTVDSTTQVVVGEAIEACSRPGGIDAGTSAVWVACVADDAVARIGLESGQREGAPIAVGPEPGAVAVGESAVWVADNGDGTVTRIEP
ncbi:MAG: protein kinase [Solirubrobacterales bacterium]|nr:protein kinase [Solirubrobacterales bacterium]